MDNDNKITFGRCNHCGKDTAIDKNGLCGECVEKQIKEMLEFFSDMLKKFDKGTL